MITPDTWGYRPMKPDDYFSVPETDRLGLAAVCRWTGASMPTIRRRVRDGLLPVVSISGKWRTTRAAVLAMVAAETDSALRRFGRLPEIPTPAAASREHARAMEELRAAGVA